MSTTSSHAGTRRIPAWLLVVAVLALLAGTWGLWRALQARSAKTQALAQASAIATPALQIAATEWLQVQEREMALGVPITGTLTAPQRAVVKARIAGELQHLQVREGDRVTQGQIIASVDPVEVQARWRQAKLQADANQAQVQIAQRQQDNNLALVQRGFISSTALATSQANLEAAQASLAAARAAQDAAQKTLSDAVLRSPLAGHVARRMVQNGEKVNVDTALVEIVNLDTLELEAQVPANDTARLQPGQHAQLQLRDSDGQKVQAVAARVLRLNPSAQTASRAVPVYLSIETQDNPALRPGMYLQGFITTQTQRTLAVPLTAVRTDQPQPYVLRAHGGVVEHVPVQLGARSMGEAPQWVAVTGLAAGDKVLGVGIDSLPAGTAIQLQEPAATLQRQD